MRDWIGMPDPVVLDIVDLHCHLGGVRAVDGASLTVRRGQITGLIGPNGAGKSTLISCISGSQRPTSGSVRYEGTDITGWAPHRIARNGMVRTFQLSSPFAGMTVLENMLTACPGLKGESLWALLRGKRWWQDDELAAVAGCRDVLAQLDLLDKQDDFAGTLSGGQKRLLELGRALMCKPKLLILDEPMAGVNPSLAARIIGELEILRQLGLTLLVVEHDLPLMERLCDDVVVMATGRVLSRGRMEDLRQQQEVVDAYLSR